MTIENGKYVKMNYRLLNPAGEVVYRAEGDGASWYIHGRGLIFPILEQALLGRRRGDRLAVALAPEDAFGERDRRLVTRVTKDRLPSEFVAEVGAVLYAAEPGGGERAYVVAEILPDAVVLDGNHPLAGVPLTCEVEIHEVRDPTADELDELHRYQLEASGGAVLEVGPDGPERLPSGCAACGGQCPAPSVCAVPEEKPRRK